MIEARDLSRAVHVSCLCACGTFSRARRWIRVDVDAREDLVARVRKGGAVEGTCGHCGIALHGHAIWLEVSRARATAQLCVPADRGAEVIQALREQLEGEDDVESFPAWMLRPEIVMAAAVPSTATARTGDSVAASVRAAHQVSVAQEEVGVPRAIDLAAPPPSSPPHRAVPGLLSGASRAVPSAATEQDEDEYTPPRGVITGLAAPAAPRHDARGKIGGLAQQVAPAASAASVVTPVQRRVQGVESSASMGRLDGAAMVGRLLWQEGRVELHVEVDAQLRRVWAQASLRTRPVLIRDAMYPLLGVRVMGSYLGESGLIDGLIDVAREEALDIWRALASTFEVSLVLESEGSALQERRQLGAAGLERNAAACLDAARVLLGGGEFLPDAYETAIAAYSSLNYADRVRPSAVVISGDDFRHIVSSHEARNAIARLDLATQPENVAALIELEGLPLSEFEEVRKRVLATSLEFGLLAPRRFWRRVVASGLAQSDTDYVEKLCAARAKRIAEGDELEAAALQRAWEEIADFCRAKDLPLPAALRSALRLPDAPHVERGPEEDPASHLLGKAEAGAETPQVAALRASGEGGGEGTSSQKLETLVEVELPSRSPFAEPPALRADPRANADASQPSAQTVTTPGTPGQSASSPSMKAAQESGLRHSEAEDQELEERTVVAAAPAGFSANGALSSGAGGERLARQKARRTADEPRSTSGEIRRSDPRLVAALGDPRTRARAAKAALERRMGVDEVCAVLGAMNAEDMIEVAGALASVSRRATESLLSQLRASSRELRQLAAVVLGEGGDPAALDPLVELLTRERTEAWLDVARAVASFGEEGLAAVQDLCPSIAHEQIKLERVARALAEMMRRDETGDLQRNLTSKRADGRAGTEAEEFDPAFARAIALAVATLPDMVAEHERLESLHADGKLSPPREFSWRLGVAIHGAEGFDAVHAVDADFEDDPVGHESADDLDEVEEFEELDEVVELSESSVRAAGMIASGKNPDWRGAGASPAGPSARMRGSEAPSSRGARSSRLDAERIEDSEASDAEALT